jgi:hypothetical protein
MDGFILEDECSVNEDIAFSGQFVDPIHAIDDGEAGRVDLAELGCKPLAGAFGDRLFQGPESEEGMRKILGE